MPKRNLLVGPTKFFRPRRNAVQHYIYLMHIRHWRRYRRMKMETLALRSGLAVGTISAIETGKQGYSRASLEAIAAALRTRPGYLLEFDPTKEQVITIRLNGHA